MTDLLPKGDTRCSGCREDRLSYKNLLTENLSDDLKRLVRPQSSKDPSRARAPPALPTPSCGPLLHRSAPFPRLARRNTCLYALLCSSDVTVWASLRFGRACMGFPAVRTFRQHA